MVSTSLGQRRHARTLIGIRCSEFAKEYKKLKTYEKCNGVNIQRSHEHSLPQLGNISSTMSIFRRLLAANSIVAMTRIERRLAPEQQRP